MDMTSIEYNDHKWSVDIAVSDIKLDMAAQRSLVGARLRKLVRNFDQIMLGALLVSERPDGYYILDGQHRLRAAAQHGVATVTCEVFSGLSKADEATLFMGRNDRANIARVDRDRNLATSGDQATLDVQMAAQSAGFVFVADKAEDSTFRDRAAGITIMNDAERRDYVQKSGVEHLAYVLQFYARAYGNQERPESSVLKALSKLFVSPKFDVDEDRLYNKLHGLPAQAIDAQARQRREELKAVRGIGVVRATQEIIAEQYNRGLSVNSGTRIRL